MEYNEHGLPAMPSALQDVGGVVREADDGDRTNILGDTAEEGALPRVRS